MTEHTFTVREAASLLDLTPTQVRSFARAGLDHPEIAGTDEARFNFRDLVVLRMAAALRRAEVPSRAISQALARLRTTGDGEVAGLHLEALGAHVVVRDGEEVWRADSGQFQFELTDAEPGASAEVSNDLALARIGVAQPSEEVDGTARVEATDFVTCLSRAISLESADPIAAIQWYRRAIVADPTRGESHTGLGFLLQQTGRAAQAIESYERALAIEADATVAFNLGVALDDLGRVDEAVAAYERALELDPSVADAHFNLSCLLEKQGDRAAALRHMIAYRELS